MEIDTLDTPAAQKPLPITVTVAGRETIVLRALVRQAIPMLECPHSFRTDQRRQLAQTLRKALNRSILPCPEEIAFVPSDADAPPEPEDGMDYEPGCLLEEG